MCKTARTPSEETLYRLHNDTDGTTRSAWTLVPCGPMDVVGGCIRVNPLDA